MKKGPFFVTRVFMLGLIMGLSLTGQIAKGNYVLGEPALFGPPVNRATNEVGACLSANGLELYFDVQTYGWSDIYVATRVSTEDEWGKAVALGSAVNGPAHDWTPRISADGLELYYASSRIGNMWSGFQIYVARRQQVGDPWQQAENLGAMINSASTQTMGSLSVDGLELYYSTGSKMRVAMRATKDSDWTETKDLAPAIHGGYPAISPGGLHLIFCTDALPGGIGGWDLWMMTRATTHDDWGNPVNLGAPINSLEGEGDCWFLYDGSAILFSRGHVGSVWQIPVHLVLDLDGDGIVDTADMHIIVDHWGRNTTLCDIAPAPFGDGIVDIQDMALLAEHMEPIDTRLVMHLKLDETSCDIANDTAINTDGILKGNPIWLPDDGIMGGALQFDGVDDYIEGPFVLDPKEGPFTLCAWIKTSEYNQVIVSQGGSFLDWLSIDASGKLATGLSYPLPMPLLTSNAVIADDLWHHIGLTTNGTSKCLYIDGVEAARDSIPIFMSSDEGLNIGTGQGLDPDSFFTGLIDDVRIYNQILEPDEIAELAL